MALHTQHSRSNSRAGELYRLLWVDAQGARVAPIGSRHLPALRFFLGPPDDARVVTSVARSAAHAEVEKKQAARSHSDLTEHHAAIGVPAASLRAETSEQDLVVGSMRERQVVQDREALLDNESTVSREQSVELNVEKQVSAIETQPQMSVAPVDESSLAPSRMQSDDAVLTFPRQEAPALATESARACDEVPPRSRAAEDEQAQSADPREQIIDDSSLNSSTVTVQLEPKTIEVTEAAWASIQAQLMAARSATR
jgi:hypothetical protein